MIKITSLSVVSGQSGAQENGSSSKDSSLHVVLLQFSDSDEESFEFLQKSFKEHKQIQLFKLKDEDGFEELYKQMHNKQGITYFITDKTIEMIRKEPMMKAYESISPDLSKLQEKTKNMKFILMKEELKGIDKKNYFHSNLEFIGDKEKILQHIESKLPPKDPKLKSTPSSSSLNTEREEHFFKEFAKHKKSSLMDISSSAIDDSKIQSERQRIQLMKIIKDGPGPGQYELQKSPNRTIGGKFDRA